MLRMSESPVKNSQPLELLRLSCRLKYCCLQDRAVFSGATLQIASTMQS